MSNINFNIISEEEWEARRQKTLLEERKQRVAEFDYLTPSSFKDTKKELLPQATLEAVKPYARRKHKALNLTLAGTSGVGKTRIAWLVLKKRYIEYGERFKAIGAETFARKAFHDKYLLESLVNIPLLLLDDLGKERATPTAEASIFELIRERMDNAKPTIYTTNYLPYDLVKRFSEIETGKAIKRRLKESSLCLEVV